MPEYDQIITTELLKKQGPKLYLAAIALPLYLFTLPYLFSRNLPLGFAFMFTVGVYMYTWIACLMHECWHRYIPDFPNDFFYNLFSYMLVMDPQQYRLVHGHHHSLINTWDDVEFHPLGEIKNTYLRRIYNFLEIIIGVIFTFGLQMHVVPKHPKYKNRCKVSRHRLSVAMWFLFYGSIGVLSAVIFSLGIWQIVIPFILSFWIGSFFIHQIQMIEHGGLIVEGDYRQRMMRTRNLKRDTLIEKTFLFLTHGDAQEHILHHATVAVYSRPFIGKLPMPEDTVYISFNQYLGILWHMVAKG